MGDSHCRLLNPVDAAKLSKKLEHLSRDPRSKLGAGREWEYSLSLMSNPSTFGNSLTIGMSQLGMIVSIAALK